MTSRFLTGVLLAIASLMLPACAQKSPDSPTAQQTAELAALAKAQTAPAAPSITVQEVVDIATDAYVYGYSLVTSEANRVQTSNVSKVDDFRAPMGRFANFRQFPPADYRGVSAPSADMLYSVAWVDLAEPQVFSHPDMGKRYFLFEMVDLWMTVVDSPGARTTGGKTANYLLTGPAWTGDVPAGMKRIAFATRYAAIVGRTHVDGTDQDLRAVNALQAKYVIAPLSARGKAYVYPTPSVNPNPAVSMTGAPQAAILAMGTAGYFNMMSNLMCNYAPPAAADAAMVARMARIGIELCKPFDASKLDAAARAALQEIPRTTLQKIDASRSMMGETVDGWVVTKGLGAYGGNYMRRAVVAAFAWPAYGRDDVVFPFAESDSAGQKLDGTNKYTLTFRKGRTPPVNGPWSVTVYMADSGWWFVPNPSSKFSLSARSNLKYNADGSLTFYLQNASPGRDKEANWLPTPKGEFIPMLRMYWPKDKDPSILNGTWKPPALQKAG
jgi:hypothetical protein